MKKFPVIQPNGGIELYEVPDDQVPEYKDIIKYFDGFIEFVVISPQQGIGAYIDDSGLLKDLPLNVPIALTFGLILAGPVMLTAIETDDEGNSLPAPENELTYHVASVARVLGDAQDKFQDMKSDTSFEFVSMDEI